VFIITYLFIVVVVIIVVVIILHRLIVIVVVVIRSNTFLVGLMANLFSNCVGLYFTINALAIGYSPFVCDV